MNVNCINRFAIGKSFLDFLFNNSIRSDFHHQHEEGVKGHDMHLLLKHEYCATLIAWLDEGSSLEASHKLIVRLTPDALGLLMASCSTPAHTDTLWSAIERLTNQTVVRSKNTQALIFLFFVFCLFCFLFFLLQPSKNIIEFLTTTFNCAQSLEPSVSQMVRLVELASTKFGSIYCSDPFYCAISSCISEVPPSHLVNCVLNYYTEKSYLHRNCQRDNNCSSRVF
jgi:hypothetical protein